MHLGHIGQHGHDLVEEAGWGMHMVGEVQRVSIA